MGRNERRQHSAKIRAHTSDDDAMALLRRPIVCGVHARHKNIIGWRVPQIAQSRRVRDVILANEPRHFGMVQMSDDPAKIVSESRPREPSHIFEKKGPRLCLADGPNRLGPHIPRIVLPLMLAPYREWLARRPAGHQIKAAGESVPIDVTHIRPFEWPIAHMLNATTSVVVNSRNRFLIPLRHQLMMKSRPRKAQGQATTATE
ncbi:hypothetical protein GmRootV213_05690 [Variovorax sp. V213]